MRSRDKIGPGYHVKDKIAKSDMDFNRKAGIMMGSGFTKKKTQKVLATDKSKAYSNYGF